MSDRYGTEVDPIEELGGDRVHELESRLRAASGYVQPSASLRGKVLGQARDWSMDRMSDRALFRTSVCVALCLVFAMFTVRRLGAWWESHPAVFSSDRMQDRADRLASEHSLQRDESLAAAYLEWREELASKWWLSGR